jgi:hypothetical protein
VSEEVALRAKAAVGSQQGQHEFVSSLFALAGLLAYSLGVKKTEAQKVQIDSV